MAIDVILSVDIIKTRNFKCALISCFLGRHPNLYPVCENNTTLSVGDTLSSSSSDYCESWTIVEVAVVTFFVDSNLRLQ